MDLISIIIPYYKKEIYKIDYFIDFKTKLSKFEIIIIYDDNCNDELKYLKNFVKIDRRIKLLINNKNIGAGPSRNKGMKLSKGKYICFLDADDLWRKINSKYN